MAKIKSRKISWDKSEADDIAGYKVYYKPDDGGSFNYDDPSISVDDPDKTSVVVPDDFPEDAFPEDGDYLIGVSAFDDIGNEADIVDVSAPFDFTPPEPITGLKVS